MTKKTAKEILNNLSENGKIGLAKSFQKLCIDCGIFMANESIAQIEVKQSFISKIFGKSEKTETKKSARKTVRKSEKKKTVQKAKKAKELDFYKFVSTDKTRPYIQGVYFDEGG